MVHTFKFYRASHYYWAKFHAFAGLCCEGVEAFNPNLERAQNITVSISETREEGFSQIMYLASEKRNLPIRFGEHKFALCNIEREFLCNALNKSDIYDFAFYVKIEPTV